MERATLDGGDDGYPGRDVTKQALSETLGTTAVSVTRYRLPPGRSLPGGLHAHWDQEGVFVVLSGEATFECLSPGKEGDSRKGSTVRVGASEAVRFEPGEFQSGHNVRPAADRRVTGRRRRKS
jgi:uncharacterized cupin superfamily protein